MDSLTIFRRNAEISPWIPSEISADIASERLSGNFPETFSENSGSIPTEAPPKTPLEYLSGIHLNFPLGICSIKFSSRKPTKHSFRAFFKDLFEFCSEASRGILIENLPRIRSKN